MARWQRALLLAPRPPVRFGATGSRRALIQPLVESPAVALLTWSVLVIECALFMALVMPDRARRILMWPGLLLHTGIAVLQGLVSFSLVMSAALILYSGWNPVFAIAPSTVRSRPCKSGIPETGRPQPSP